MAGAWDSSWQGSSEGSWDNSGGNSGWEGGSKGSWNSGDSGWKGGSEGSSWKGGSKGGSEGSWDSGWKDSWDEDSGKSKSGQAVLKLLGGARPKPTLVLGGPSNESPDGTALGAGNDFMGGAMLPPMMPPPANPFAGMMGGFTAGPGGGADAGGGGKGCAPSAGWMGSGSFIGAGEGTNGTAAGSEWPELQMVAANQAQDSWGPPQVVGTGGMQESWPEWPEVQGGPGNIAGGSWPQDPSWQPDWPDSHSGAGAGMPGGALRIGHAGPGGDLPVGGTIMLSGAGPSGNLQMGQPILQVGGPGGSSLPPGVPIGQQPGSSVKTSQASDGKQHPVPHAPGSGEFRAIFPPGEIHDAMAANPMMAALTGPVAASCSDTPVPGGPCALELLQEATIDPTKASDQINDLIGLGSCSEADVQAAALKLTMKQCYAFSNELAKAMGYHSLEHYELHKQALIKAQTRGNKKKFGDDNGKRLTLFVGGLRRETDDAKLTEHFSKYGVVAKSDVIRSSDGHSRGFAFVKFATEEGIQNAIESKFEHILDGQWVNTKISDPNRADAGKNASRAVEIAAAQAGVDPKDYLEHLSKKAEEKYGFGSSLLGEEKDPFQRSKPY